MDKIHDERLRTLSFLTIAASTPKKPQHKKCDCGQTLYSVRECERGTCATCSR